MQNFKLVLPVVIFAVGVLAKLCLGCDRHEVYATAPREVAAIASEPARRSEFICDGKMNYDITKPTPDEQLQIDQLIYKVNFESTILNFFANGIHTVRDVVRGIFAKSVKTLLNFQRYLLNVEIIGGDANFRIQGASKTYSHVVTRVGRVVSVTEIRDAFVKSCQCGQTVYLN